MSLRSKIKTTYISESGRSMVEMLGVLAIIGVLSIAGIAGYQFALNKFRANEIINELNARALSVSAQMLSTDTPYEINEVIEDGFGNTLALGYPAESGVSSQNADYFEITIDNIPSKICSQILRDYENPIMIFVNDVRYNGDTALCESASETSDMGFIYRRDLGEREVCSDRGYFGEDDFICHCAGNTYIDPTNPNECLCPAKHVWDYTEKTCVLSNCKENEFEYQTKCISCTDEGLYKVDQAQCNLCKNRVWDGYFHLCARKDKCVKGESFPVITSMGFGKCELCTQPNDTFNGRLGWGIEWCEACGNRHQTSYGSCVITDKCTKGKHVRYMTSGGGNSGCAESCNSTEKLNIGTGIHEKELCEACVNTNGVKNRKVVDSTCVKAICDSDEFMGSDGSCYKCTTNTAISVGENSGCESQTCNRQVVNGKCQLKDCSGGVRLGSGACYDCAYKNGFKVTSDAEISACEACPKRHVNSSNYCIYEKCSLGSNFLEISGTHCQGCSDTRSLGIGTSAYQVNLCNGCTTAERIALNSGQCAKKQCIKGTQGMTSTGGCFLCESATAQTIGYDSYTAELCLGCNPKRFTAGNKCYLCNTIETPTLETQKDIDSCLDCAMRDVQENKCVLLQ